MIEHTHHKPQYGVVVGRKLFLYVRPARTRQKQYRCPILAGIKRFRSKAEAELARKHYEGILI